MVCGGSVPAMCLFLVLLVVTRMCFIVCRQKTLTMPSVLVTKYWQQNRKMLKHFATGLKHTSTMNNMKKVCTECLSLQSCRLLHSMFEMSHLYRGVLLLSKQ